MSTINKLIVVLGPTASGKSELALRLAKKFNGEIINADSRQIYKNMLIGTGSSILCHFKLNCHSEFISESIIDFKKDNSIQTNQKVSKIKTKQNINQGKIPELNSGQALKQVQDDKLRIKNDIIINKIPHHLFHFIEPKQNFSVAEYKELAIKIIRDIQRRGKIPILVGGTGLYISSVVDNLEIPKAAPSGKIRNKLEKHTEKYLFSKLQKIDPKSASIIGKNNKRKLVRALEVFEITGKPFSTQQIKGEPLFNALQIGIKIDREELYKKIDKRVDKMLELGLVEETKKLSRKYSFDLPSMSGIGYFEIGQYLENKMSLDEAIQKMKYRTHHYARRQMTWFKKDKRIKWVDSYKKTVGLVSNFLNRK